MARTSPLVAQYTLKGDWSAVQELSNVIQVRLTHQVASTRGAAVAREAQIIADAWVTHALPSLANNYTLLRVEYIDLHTTSGVTGSVVPTGTPPFVGGSASAVVPQNVAVILTKTVAGIRGTRAGRMFLPPPAESSVGELGQLDGPAIAGYNTIGANFLSAITIVPAEGDPHVLQAELVTVTWPTVDVARPPVKRPDPDGVGVSNTVLSLECETLVGTQRRRLRD